MTTATTPPIRDRKDAALVAEVKRRGLQIERHGAVWRIHGHGVDILTVDLALVKVGELRAAA